MQRRKRQFISWSGNVNYFAFEWNQHLQDWNLMVSHDTWAAQEVQLLAEK